jgi:dTDP-4-amino-4,6-dideoxygalactose transaminase
MLRDHGQSKKYYHDLVGANSRMDGIQGAVLSVKLEHLNGWNESRRNRAATYRRLLHHQQQIKLIEERGDGQHVYHLFVARVPNRDEVMIKLKESGIGCGIHYPIPVHLQKAYASMGLSVGRYPVSETLASEIVSLPMYPEMTDEQVTEVADRLVEAVEECSNEIGRRAIS